MRPEDLEQYRVQFPHWVKLTHDVREVCLLSGTPEQVHVVTDAFEANGSCVRVDNVTRDRWDLNEPVTDLWTGFDLIVAMNVFMYSPDPDLWFRNVLAKCRYLWLQDPVCGKRGEVELGDGPRGDGDAARYGLEPLLRPRIPAPQGYDLARYQERFIRLCAYRLDVPPDVPYGLSYMAFLRGDL